MVRTSVGLPAPVDAACRCAAATAGSGGGGDSALLFFCEDRGVGAREAFVSLRPGVLPRGRSAAGRARRRRGAGADAEELLGRWFLPRGGCACSDQALGGAGVGGDDKEGAGAVQGVVADGRRADAAVHAGRDGRASARGDGGGACRETTLQRGVAAAGEQPAPADVEGLNGLRTCGSIAEGKILFLPL